MDIGKPQIIKCGWNIDKMLTLRGNKTFRIDQRRTEEFTAMARKAAYAVLLASDDYLAGAKVLAWSLRAVNSFYPLVVMYKNGVRLDGLGDLGCILRPIETLSLPQENQYAQSHFGETWTKLQVFGLTEYERIVLLDADMLIQQNIDELIEMELPEGWIAAAPACKCNPLKIKSYPKDWTPETCDYTPVSTSAARAYYFNSGTVVLRPPTSKLQEMRAILVEMPDSRKYCFADQDFLNEVFNKKSVQLSYRYNGLKTLRLSHPSLRNLDEVKVIHYILEKPWINMQWMNLPEEKRREDPFYEVKELWFDAHAKMCSELFASSTFAQKD